MFKAKTILIVLVGILTMGLMAAPVGAQDQSQQQPQTTDTDSTQRISDGQLEKVAEAYIEIRQIHEEFQQSVQKAHDEEKRLQLQQQANQMMVAAVENTGIEVETYNSVIQQVQVSERLSQRFIEKIQGIETKQ
jgi:hypothetical protein